MFNKQLKSMSVKIQAASVRSWCFGVGQRELQSFRANPHPTPPLQRWRKSSFSLIDVVEGQLLPEWILIYLSVENASAWHLLKGTGTVFCALAPPPPIYGDPAKDP